MRAAKKKKVTAKEGNLLEKEKDCSKRKIVAAKESNSQKKTKKYGKRSQEKHH